MDNQSVLLNIENGIATLTLNRPERMNSFNQNMHLAFQAAMNKVLLAAQDKTARVLVLTGAGKGFCAGQDLAAEEVQFQGEQAPDLGRVVRDFYAPMVLQLQSLPIPTVAAVNGVAAGAGASLALACDLIIAKESASFIQAFSKVGLIPDTGGTWFLPQRVGMARAMGLALLGTRLFAPEAVQMGLIWAAVADEAFDAYIAQIGHDLSLAPTQALVSIRHAMQKSQENDLAEHLALEADYMATLGKSHDYHEGVMAFVEKRSPQFRGI